MAESILSPSLRLGFERTSRGHRRSSTFRICSRFRRSRSSRFLQANVEMEKRENVGLQAVFNSVFPIKDFNDTASLEFVGYTLEQPKYDVQECLQRGMTYAAPFKVTIRLIAWEDASGLPGDPRREGAGGLLRGNPDHDRQRHLHHQRHRAGHRLPAAPLARHLLRFTRSRPR